MLDQLVLCVVRCGETTWEEEHRLLGSADLPLSASGRTAVTSLTALVGGQEPAAVHHPPDEAATETARVVRRALGVRRRVVAGLADPHLGLLEGMTEATFAERFPRRHRQWLEDPLALVPPEGESFADARVRIFATLARLLKRSRTGQVTVVLHELGLGFLRCWLAQRPGREMWTLGCERPRVERYALSAAMARRLTQVEEPEAVSAAS